MLLRTLRPQGTSGREVLAEGGGKPQGGGQASLQPSDMQGLCDEEEVLQLQVLDKGILLQGRGHARRQGQMLPQMQGAREGLRTVETGADFMEKNGWRRPLRILFLTCLPLPSGSRYCIIPSITHLREGIEMTCQWCIHYRRRKGVSLCFAAFFFQTT